MAASTSVMNATDVLVSISTDGGSTYTVVGKATSAGLSVTMDTRDTSTKDSSGWRELLEGQKSWSLTCDGLVCYNISGKETASDLFGYLSNRTALTVKFGSAGSAEKIYSGTAYLTSLSQDAGVEENVTFSASFEGSSTLTEAANP